MQHFFIIYFKKYSPLPTKVMGNGIKGGRLIYENNPIARDGLEPPNSWL